MAQYDGTITLQTKVDTAGITKSTSDVKTAAASVGNAFDKIKSKVVNAVSSGDAASQKLAASAKRAAIEMENQAKKVEELRTRLQSLQAGEIIPSDNGIKKIQTELKNTNIAVQKTKAEITSLYTQLDVLQTSAFKAPDTGEILLTKSEQAKFDAIYAKLDQLEPKLQANKTKAEELGKALQKAVGTATQTNIDKTAQKLGIAEIKLEQATSKANAAAIKAQAGTTNIKNSIDSVSSGFQKLGNRMAGLIKSVFVFSLITSALGKLRDRLGSVLSANTQVSSAVQNLKNSFWTLAAPLINAVIPALTAFINALATALNYVAKFVALLTGKSFMSMQKQGKAMQSIASSAKKTSKSTQDIGKAAKKSNKEVGKMVASFDELQILSATPADSGRNGSAGGSGGGGADMGGISAVDNGKSPNAYADEVVTALAKIGAAVGVSLMAIGVIILLTGNVGWGIGFIIAGAAIYAVSEAVLSGDPSEEAQNKLQTLKNAVIPALFALGVLCIFMGAIPIGIGLIVAGAALYGVKEMNAQAKEDPALSAANKIYILMQAVGAALAAVGIMLIFFGQIPIGLGFLIMGASVFGVTSKQLKENGVTTKISKFLKDNQDLIVGVSLAILVVGLILFACGQITPLSLGLLIAGATGLAAEAAINNTEVKTIIQTFLRDNAALVVGISLALLVLGIILCCCGIVSPLSIGLIAAGAVGLAAELYLNWNEITNKVSTFFKNNQALVVGVSLALLVLGIVLCCTGVALPLGIGLIVVGAVGLAEEVYLNWDFIKTKTEEVFNNVLNWVKTWGLLVLGIVLVFTGAGLPLGLGLIKKGADGLAEAEDPLWDTVYNKIVETWNSIKTFWNQYIAVWFTAKQWEDLADKVGQGLKTGFKNAINGVASIFELGINFIISAFNKLKVNIPDWVPGVGGQTWGVNINPISIPPLAQGAVLPPNKPFLAVVGDQAEGTNVEAPLDTIKQAVAEVLAVVGAGTNQPVIIELDGREFGRAVIKQGNRESLRATGKLVFG